MNPLRPWFRMYTHARTSKKLHCLTDAEHRLWFKLLCYASEQEPAGSFRIDADTALEVDVLDADNEGDAEELARLLSPRRMVRLIDDLGDGLYQMHDYAGWQKPSDSPTATRARKAKERAARRRRDAENVEGVTAGHAPVTRDTKNGHATELELEVEVEVEREVEKPSCPKGIRTSPDFDAFWEAYPKDRREGKKTAFAKYQVALKLTTPEAILAGLERVKQGWRDPQYIPLPTTWLNRGGWEDAVRPTAKHVELEYVEGTF